MSQQRKIYYSVSVRGGITSRESVVKQVEILKRYGQVLTEHLASENTDLGMTDEEIRDMDVKFIDMADIVIADIGAISDGVGHVTGLAAAKNKKIACFYHKDQRQKISAMINGCREIKIYSYDALEGTNNSFETQFRRFLISLISGIKTFLMGPPGSGKSTVSQSFRSNQIPNISTGAIIREICKDDKHPLAAQINTYMKAGQLIPAKIMEDIVFMRLTEPDCINYGFALDGYPPSYEDLLNLRKYDITPDIVFYFECSDKTAIERQCGRKSRETDNVKDAEERMRVYHAGVPDYRTLCHQWFPSCPVVRVNAENDGPSVITYVMTTLFNIFRRPIICSIASYFPIEIPISQVKSEKIHFHIDSGNLRQLSDVIYGVYSLCPELQGQIKIYPIEELSLGSQQKSMKIYEHMMNFHEIHDSHTEAFATGRLGISIDMNLINRIMSVFGNKNFCKNAQARYMFEIEQYVGAWDLIDGEFLTNDTFNAEAEFDQKELSTYNSNLLPNVPPFELHLAFDIVKCDLVRPIDISDLKEKCRAAGLDNGGWFIFKKTTHWAYRTNEFSFSNRKTCEETVKRQAILLQNILDEYGFKNHPISASLEIVHGIWAFN